MASEVDSTESEAKSKYLIAYFSSQISAEDNKGLEIALQPKADDGRRKLWSCETRNGMRWVGRRDSALLGSTRLVLLTRDRHTGQICIASDSTNAIRFLPVCVVDAADAPSAIPQTPAGAGKRKRQQEAATAVYEEFGSTAKKRRIAEAKKLNASVTAKDLKAAAATAAKRLEKAGAAADASQQQASILPPRDPRSGAYSLDALCPARLRAALLPLAERLASAGPAEVAAWRAEATYSDALVLERLPRLPTEPAGRLDACVRLAMLTFLRKFSQMNYKQVNRKSPIPGLPEDVANHLLDNYSEQVITPGTGTHRALTQQIKDKQLIHMIIMCLQLDGYTTDTSGLMSEFRLASQRLGKLLKVIDCEIVTEVLDGKEFKLARLKVTGG